MPIADYGDVPVGFSVIAIGHPSAYFLLTTKGIVTGCGPAGDCSQYTFDMTTGPGGSGGPIVDMSGRLVSVVLAMATEDPRLVFGPAHTVVRAFLGR